MNDNYLSRKNTDCLKGVCAVMVVLCHVCARTGIGASIGLGPIYSAFGYLGVSGFMFMSGYGLTYSLFARNNDRGGYLQNFLTNRVLPVYLLMALLAVIYLVLKCSIGLERPTMAEFAQSFFFGRTVISFGWYLQCIVLIYLIYYAAAHLAVRCKSDVAGSRLCWLVALGMILFVGLCLLLKLDSTWYETVLSFWGGVVVAENKPCLDSFWQKKSHVLVNFCCLATLFVFCFVLGNGPFISGSLKIVLKMISSLAFCLCWISVMRLVSLENAATYFLGNLYLEIYIIQGAIYLLLRNKYWYLESQWGFFVIAITLVILGSYMIKPMTTSFMKTVKNKNK